ncbi:hypothetical protein LCM28_05620 [Salipiger pacificus]|nr:hypothetical protein [Alloyangia pacifica]
MSRRNVCSPTRPTIDAFDGRMLSGVRGVPDLSKRVRDMAFERKTGKAGVSTAQAVFDLHLFATELQKAEMQALEQAIDFELAAAVIKGEEPETHHTEDKFGIIEAAVMIREYMLEMQKGAPEFDLGVQIDLAADCQSLAKKLRNGVDTSKGRRKKVEEYLNSAVLEALCDDDTSEHDFDHIVLNTDEGQKLFADFDVNANDFVAEFNAADKHLRPANPDNPTGLQWQCVKLRDGRLLNRIEYVRERYRDAKRLVPLISRESLADAQQRQKMAGKKAQREDIKSKLAGVWK